MDLKIKTETMDTEFNPWRVKSLEDFTSVVYSCPECESSFSTSEQFVCHAMISHQKARDTLPEILNAKPLMNQEFVEVKQDSKLECMETYQCELCPMFFNSEVGLTKHKRGGHRCEFCTVIYLSVQGKLNHLSDSHNFQCDQCRQIFRLKTDLKYHESQTHPRPKTRPKFNCNTCGKSFPSKEGRDHHMKKGSKKCNQLRKSLKSKKSDLKQRKKMKISKD